MNWLNWTISPHVIEPPPRWLLVEVGDHVIWKWRAVLYFLAGSLKTGSKLEPCNS